MFEFLRKKRNKPPAAYQIGQKAGAAMAEAVETYLNHRLAEVSEKMLALLQQRFTTIHDEPEHAPELVAKVEYQIFMGHLETLPARIHQEAHDALGKWFDIARKSGVLDELNRLIETRINEARMKLMGESLAMFAEACALEKKA